MKRPKREIEAMEIGEEGATTMARKNKNLAIEDYLDFIDNRDHQLTLSQLRQIIGMHGFKRIEGQKSILIDAVKTMDLMDLGRSTLQDGCVSGDARLTLKEVIRDLKSLQWQECHVTSLLTQGAAASATSATTGRTVSVKRKKSKGLGKKAVEVAVDHCVISTTGTTVAAGSTPVSVKRKKSKGLGKKPVEAAVDHSVNSTTGTTVAAGSTTVSVKRKRAKGLGKKPVEVAVDHSVIPTTGTTVAAESTTKRSVEGNSSEF